MKKTGWLPNYYARLGVPRNATAEEIRSAYRAAVRRLHPDVNPAPGAAELLQAMREAYEVLSDPARRAEYDQVLPPDTSSAPSVSLNVLYSRPVLPPLDEPQLLYVLLSLHSIREQPPPRPRLNVCLVLDKSTSMQGVRLDSVKAVASQLLARLQPGDSFAVVAFSDRAEVIIPAGQPMDPEQADARIRMLQAAGGTEIYQGLLEGYQQILHNPAPGQIHHIFLVTDGRTYGDEAQCLRLADQCAEHNIRISGIGIGHEWNDQFLDALAARTGGQTAFAARPEALKQFLERQFDQLAHEMAGSVNLHLDLTSQASLRYVIRIAPSVLEIPRAEDMALGTMTYSQGMKVLLEFLIPPIPPQTEEIVLGTARFRVALPGQSEAASQISHALGRPTGTPPPDEEVPQAILQALGQLSLYRLQEEAWQDVETGDLSKATRRLKNLATHLFAQGEKELARTVLLEAGRLERGEGLSEEGRKRLKYGTRALLLPPGGEEA